MKYRAEIDGLRALAVVPVILFHAGFELFSGGFVGVDVFFVISGYLITTILIEDIENNKFSIVNFYERRARRILPALFFVMLVCIPFAWMWMQPGQMKDFSMSLVAVSIFASNILFWLESDYFAPAAEETPLLHTWSLAVEEQYYVLFPIILLLAWRFGKNYVFWMIVLFAAGSLALSEWSWRNNATANFYLAQTRAWELFAGSIAAFIVQRRGVQANNAMSFMGLVAIVFSIFVFNESTPFPSVYALVPVVGVVLLVLFADKETIAAKLLSLKVFVGIGLISYSAYLWHQPLFAFARIRAHAAPSDLLMLLLATTSLVLAVFSWKYVERPFRRREGIIKKRRTYFAFSVMILSGFIVVGMAGHINDGYSQRFDHIKFTTLDLTSERNPYREKCHLGPERNTFEHPVGGCTDFFVNNNASVMLVGDSHLDAVAYPLQLLLKEKGVGSYSVSYGGCIGLAGFYRVDEDNTHRCHEYNESMIAYAKESGIGTIVIVSRFPLYLDGNRFDNGEGGIEYGDRVYIDTINHQRQKAGWKSVERKERVKENFYSSIEQLLGDFKVVLVEPIPEVGYDVPKYLAQARMYNKHLEPSTAFAQYQRRNEEVLRVFDRIIDPRLFRVKTAEVFCSNNTQRCNISDSHGLFYRDDDHLSLYGAEVLAPRIVKLIELALADY